MKKILIFLLISLIPIVGFGQSKFKRGISIGNDKTGTHIVTIDSAVKVGTNFTFYNGASRLNVTNDDTVSLTNVGFVAADTNTILATRYYAETQGGGGTVGSFSYLRGRVGVTDGLPINGDSLLIHTDFIGKHITVFREGQLQEQNPDNTETDGFRFSNTTGTIVFRPILTTNEQIEVWATNTILWTSLIPEGGPGVPPPETPLLDNLLAYYALDEVSGTTVNDDVGSNDGTTNALVNQTGHLGRAETFSGTQNITIPYNSSLLPTNDEFSISLWFRITQMPSTAGRPMFLFAYSNSADPWYPIYVSLENDADNYIAFRICNTTGTTFAYETSQASVPYSINTWYHVVCVNEGAGSNAKIYVNAVDKSSYSSAVFSGTVKHPDSSISTGNLGSAGAYSVVGSVDEVAVYDRALTSGEVTQIYNSTTGYPFN